MYRDIVYVNEIPTDTDFLLAQKHAYLGQAKSNEALFGATTLARGFIVTPTAPASMQVSVAPGEIYAQKNIDDTAYGSLAADTTHQIVKQGVVYDATLPTALTAPVTVGQSINYLVQVAFSETDGDIAYLQYYNSTPPYTPFAGPNNTGVSQATTRKNLAVVTTKAGTPATTGSQVTPAPDAGNVGVAVVTVAYGATTIIAGNITAYAAAALLPAGGVIAAVQNKAYVFGTDIGAANAYAAYYLPAVTALSDGMELEFQCSHTNTGASTFSPNGLATHPIIGLDHAAMSGGEIVAGGKVTMKYHAGLSSWLLLQSTNGAFALPAGAKISTPPTLGERSSKIASTQWVHDTGWQFGHNSQAFNAGPVTLTNTPSGSLVLLSGTGTLTLPSLSAMAELQTISFGIIGTQNWTLQRAGSDTITPGVATAPLTSILLLPGDTITLLNTGGGNWTAIAGSARLQYAGVFGASVASPGYQKLPSGLIVQWGQVTTSGSPPSTTWTYPLSFPNSVYQVFATALLGANATHIASVGTSGASSTPIYSDVTTFVNCFAIGH